MAPTGVWSCVRLAGRLAIALLVLAACRQNPASSDRDGAAPSRKTLTSHATVALVATTTTLRLATSAPTSRPRLVSTAPPPRPAPPPPPVRPSGALCITADLEVVPAGTRASGSTQVVTFRVTNRGPTSCLTAGYPKVSPYRSSSSVQANVVPIPPGEGAIGAPAREVSLGPAKTAVFHIQWRPAPNGPDDCQDADGIIFDVPGGESLVPVPFPFRFCGRAIRQSVIQIG
jgi:hypothetical protein